MQCQSMLIQGRNRSFKQAKQYITSPGSPIFSSSSDSFEQRVVDVCPAVGASQAGQSDRGLNSRFLVFLQRQSKSPLERPGSRFESPLRALGDPWPTQTRREVPIDEEAVDARHLKCVGVRLCSVFNASQKSPWVAAKRVHSLVTDANRYSSS